MSFGVQEVHHKSFTPPYVAVEKDVGQRDVVHLLSPIIAPFFTNLTILSVTP